MIMDYGIFDKINTPDDIKKLDQKEIAQYCDEARGFLIDKVGQNGGHLSSNLGVVELSVALHRVFDSPRDHIIFDVGHQSYIHKAITGRRDLFDTLRTPGGLSGFTSRRESEHDPFGAGHSSTALSAALGFAESDKLDDKNSYSVAVIGDGAYTGGMIHEAINNCKPDLKLVIILNENGMSISNNRGVFASYLSRFIASKKYIDVKESTRSFLNRIPILGKIVSSFMSVVKKMIKRLLYETNYFEELGFYYIGPIDGNDYKKVEKALKQAKQLSKCVFVHIKTVKGKGLDEAETAPDKFHSVTNNVSHSDSFHSVFADALIEHAEIDRDIIAVTAAMGIGTGLSKFEEKFPDRYYDVGIAEPHALTFAAAMAASGKKPVIAIYSTFLQRAYDNIVHDIALQNLPVKIFIDRAGLAVSDGPTHHGIFDVAFLSHIPGMQILAPADYRGLARCIDHAFCVDAPIAVRYPNASESCVVRDFIEKSFNGEQNFIHYDFDPASPPENIIISYGSISEKAILASRILKEKGVECGVIITEQLMPNESLVGLMSPISAACKHILYVEEGIKAGGAAMLLRDAMFERGMLKDIKFDIAAICDSFALSEMPGDLYDQVGLSVSKILIYFTD